MISPMEITNCDTTSDLRNNTPFTVLFTCPLSVLIGFKPDNAKAVYAPDRSAPHTSNSTAYIHVCEFTRAEKESSLPTSRLK